MLIHQFLSRANKVLNKGKLSILIYHQVFAERDPMRASEPDAVTFRWQMELVKKYFHPLSISAALVHLEQNTLPSNAVCITFDDGYINNLEVATPILKELDIPATVYVATAFSLGENMWNDRLIDLVSANEVSTLTLKALKEAPIKLGDTENRVVVAHQLIKKIKYLPFEQRKTLIDALYLENRISDRPRKMMSVQQIQQLQQLGIEIGAHTVDHPILKVIDETEQLAQMQQSKQALEQILLHRVKGFAYPNGKLGVDYDSATRDLAEQVGFDYAVSTNWGISSNHTDKFQLNRFTPWDKTPLKFHLRLIRNLIGL
ncbi:MAG: polysaccharide deacetylase family protein [Colwellia sp.]|nr:polysaccharide deacetylase family protein [Colwellia sp.]